MTTQNNCLLKQHITKVSNNLMYLLNMYSLNILDLSKDVGISYSATYRLVHGDSNPNLETLLKIAKSFNISISQLLGEIPIDSNNYMIQSIPIIDWNNIMNFLDDNKSTKSVDRILISTKNSISNKGFAIQANQKNTPIFDSGTTLVFDRLVKKIEEYDNKFVLLSSKNSVPIIKKLFIDDDKVFLQALNNTDIPVSELLDISRIIAILVHYTNDF